MLSCRGQFFLTQKKNFCCVEKNGPRQDSLDREQLGKETQPRSEALGILWAQAAQFEQKSSLEWKHKEKTRYFRVFCYFVNTIIILATCGFFSLSFFLQTICLPQSSSFSNFVQRESFFQSLLALLVPVQALKLKISLYYFSRHLLSRYISKCC